MERGEYADGREFELPNTWPRVDDETRRLALGQVYDALDLAAAPGAGADVVTRLARYYATDGDFAGALFLDLEPNTPDVIGEADLLAVTTLSMRLPARLVRVLLRPSETRNEVHRLLRSLDTDIPITDLQPGMLATMWELHHLLKTTLSTETRESNWWVFAAKLCARKRPDLFPVRDNAVAEYLAAGLPRGLRSGRVGNFSIDLQLYAWFMTDSKVTTQLHWLYDLLAKTRGVQPDTHPLRLLDAALWTRATGVSGSV
jgi:hypothetical protein